MCAQAFRKPEAVQPQNVAKFQRGGGVSAMFVGVVFATIFARNGARAGGMCPRFLPFRDLRLFAPCFSGPAGHRFVQSVPC